MSSIPSGWMNVTVNKDGWIEIFGPFEPTEAERLTETIQAVIPNYVEDDSVFVYCDEETT